MSKLSETLSNLLAEITSREVKPEFSQTELTNALYNGVIELLAKYPEERAFTLSIALIRQLTIMDRSDTEEMRRCLGYIFLLSLALDIFPPTATVNS